MTPKPRFAELDETFPKTTPVAPIHWPNGKRFAFTIVDDTDLSTLANTKPVYDFLGESGLRTTKTVWPLHEEGQGNWSGESLQNGEYRAWIIDLKRHGFEIGLHGVAANSSSRERIIEGLDRFQAVIGNGPAIHTNHVGQKESLYWGSERFDPPVRWIYKLFRFLRTSAAYRGGHLSTPNFWGDLCQQRIKYVRNFVFRDINTLKMDPLMPYHDPKRPYVRYWFSSSYGSSVERFCRLISPKNQDRLMTEGGACIVYTHLGSTFFPLTQQFKMLIRRLAAMQGWFVPATELLDYVGQQRGWPSLAEHQIEYANMQWRWLLQRVMSARVYKRWYSIGGNQPTPRPAPDSWQVGSLRKADKGTQ